MQENNWNGKKIRVLLKNGFCYTGPCIADEQDAITLIDKFDKQVELAKDSIMVIEEVIE